MSTRTDMSVLFLWNIYVAKDLLERLAGVLDRCKFFALQTDGTSLEMEMEMEILHYGRRNFFGLLFQF